MKINKMKNNNLNRRDFTRLTAAALGGIVAGSSLIGCSPAANQNADGTTDGGDVADADKHICRGLNACKGKGAKGENACAGQGACATIAAHDCGGQNECKGQGGCGDTYGKNECKGKGECAIPLMEGKWAEARKAFEERMKAEGKEFGEAPAKS